MLPSITSSPEAVSQSESSIKVKMFFLHSPSLCFSHFFPPPEMFSFSLKIFSQFFKVFIEKTVEGGLQAKIQRSSTQQLFPTKVSC